MNKGSDKDYKSTGKRNNCGVSIIKPDTLLSWYWEFLTKDMIKKKCMCQQQAVCLALVDLLANGKHKEAQDILLSNKK